MYDTGRVKEVTPGAMNETVSSAKETVVVHVNQEFDAEKPVPVEDVEKLRKYIKLNEEEQNIEERASIFSKMFFLFVSPMVTFGFKQPLKEVTTCYISHNTTIVLPSPPSPLTSHLATSPCLLFVLVFFVF